MSAVIVCRVGTFNTRHIQWCPVCQARKRCVTSWPASPYYSPEMICCGCGDTWNEDGRRERPFCRGWRKRAIAEAERQWVSAVRHGHPEHLTWRAAWMDEYRLAE